MEILYSESRHEYIHFETNVNIIKVSEDKKTEEDINIYYDLLRSFSSTSQLIHFDFMSGFFTTEPVISVENYVSEVRKVVLFLNANNIPWKPINASMTLFNRYLNNSVEAATLVT